MIGRAPTTVSIVLPTYNRARFLPQAIESIRGQEFGDWELIIVDDGSTDETAEILPELTAGISQPVRSIRQENQGAYGARNTGLDHAGGRFIAFYDSDDTWLPDHLQHCAAALEANGDVDWVYDACRIVLQATGDVLTESTFRVDGRRRPFMALETESRGELFVITDQMVACCQIEHGMYCGLQNSVMRRQLFDDFRFEAESRNEAEDQLLVIDRMLAGFRLGYLDRVGVVYTVHEENSSAAGTGGGFEKRARVLTAVAKGFELLLKRSDLTRDVRSALKRRVGEEYVWHLGYATRLADGECRAALADIAKGISYWPWDWRFWKTYFACCCKWMATICKAKSRGNVSRCH